jgi:GTPase SAR1 family protein
MFGRQVVCPYCFEGFTSSEVAFRCIRPAGCPPEEDKPLSDYQRLTATMMLPRVFTPSPGWRTPTSARCTCGTRSTKAVCPHCHNTLPGQFSATSHHTIALIGAKGAGKSNYIAVLVHELRNKVGQRFNAALNALDEQTIKRYREHFERFVYDKREVVPATPSGMAALHYPLVYRLGITRRWLRLFRRNRATTLVLFDTAGEDLGNSDTMAIATRYFASSHGLIFLLDPLQIPAVRQLLGLPELAAGEAEPPGDIIFRVCELIRKLRGIGPEQPIRIPVAIVFSKIDEVRRILEPDSILNRASEHDGAFDLADAEEVDETVRAHVNRWLGPNFHATLEQNFSLVRYFGISALGDAPTNDGTLPRGVQAFRVEDPFLWLLHRNGYIKGERGARA